MNYQIKLILLVAVFTAAINSLIFTCEYRMHPWPAIGERYTCWNPTISGSGNTLTAVFGNHTVGKGNAQVEFLYVWYQTINALPKNIDRFFQNLVAFHIYNSELLKISAEDLQPFPQLLFFVSEHNPLVSLDGDLFKHTRKMRLVMILNSQLQHVGYDLLTDLHFLEWVSFHRNPCINADAVRPDTIAALNRDLPISCPSLTTTTVATTITTAPTTTVLPDVCSAPCLKLVHQVESKASELSEHNVNQDKKIAELKSENVQQQEIISTFEERINILEGIVIYHNISIYG